MKEKKLWFPYLGTAVWVDGVVCEPDLVPLPGGVHHVLVVQVEQERAHVLVVHLEITINCQKNPEELNFVLHFFFSLQQH